VLLLAVSDVHSPKYLFQYIAALSKAAHACREAAAMLWAGDMVLKGRVDALKTVIMATRSRCGDIRVIAVYGNEEYMGTEEEYRRRYPEITWLDDDYTVVEGEDARVCIYGTRGSLDRPTRWQRRHMPWITSTYRRRALKAAETLKRLRGQCSHVILLSHYAPTYATLEGEPSRIWPEMGSKLFEKAIAEARPDAAIHGHAHNSKRHTAVVHGVLVVNVALPATGRITIVRVKPEGGVELA